MANPDKAQAAGNEVVALMAELGSICPLLSEPDRRRTLDKYAPRMAELLTRQSAALAEEVPAGG